MMGQYFSAAKGEPHGVMDALCEMGFPECVVEVCRVGLTKTGEVMAPFTALLWQELQSTTSHAEPDDILATEFIGDIPCWAFDMHTREGKQAIGRFLKLDCETTRWLSNLTPPVKRTHLIDNMLFRVEGGCVDQRLRWKTGDRLRHMCDAEIWGVSADDMNEGLRLLRQDLAHFNEARAVVYEGR